MSYSEALRDGIVTGKDKNGFTWYYPKCHICGCSVPSWSYIQGTVYTCDKCRKLLIEQQLNEKHECTVENKKHKLTVAIERISKVADISKYKNAVDLVQTNIEKQGWFQSTEEIMTALELIKCGVVAHHQVKVFDYSVDFVLPELQVALEIDGKPFHRKEDAATQSMRDEVIVNKLGKDWQMIHIAAENINLNVTKLMPAIKAVLRYRKKHSLI